MITFIGPLKSWTFADGTSHFMSVPVEFAAEIRIHAMEIPRGFRSVKVKATVQDFTWRTSIFPSKDSGGFFLPIKIEVLRRTGIAPGDPVGVELELL